MTITAYSYTNQGGRVHNEDSLRLGHGNGRELSLIHISEPTRPY